MRDTNPIMSDTNVASPVNSITSDLFIIGIGASAGGLDSIYTIFEKPLPANASFVIIQHLPPDYKSNTAALLAKHSNREIKEVQNNLLIEPDTVYVMTERKNIIIKNGRLFTTDDRGKQPNNSVDILLQSLAEEKGNKSIAVILSGANDDGTKGAEAIKNAGGMVIAQDPLTSQFDVMPASAIASGNVDAILAPELIMNELHNYIRQGILMSQFTDNNEAALLEVLDLVRDNTPLNFANYKRATIVRRIVRRMVQHNIGSLNDYISYLKEHSVEIDLLSKEFMISVTRFFRDAAAFEIIREKVIPDILQNKMTDATLKVWIVGCATGEEAYSLGILIHEYLSQINRYLNIKIFASDIDQKALSVASKGIYPESIAEDVSEERLSKFFHKEGHHYRIKEHIRSMMIFSEHDITRHPPYYKLDLISCRNVLIYMNPILQKKILATLHYCLNLGGYLFLGPSENVLELKEKVSEIDKKWKIYKNIQVATNLDNGTYATPKYGLYSVHKPTAITKPIKRKIQSDDISSLINASILKEFGYAGVSVDERFKIVQTFGEFNKYLLPEMFNFNLLEMLPKELSISTGINMRKAFKENIEILVKDITFEDKDGLRSVNVLIKPIVDNRSSEKVLLVLFNEQKPKESEAGKMEIFQKDKQVNRYVEDLVAELKETKLELKEIYEALETSNDNAQAYNEELISGNEELQSTNEEVQSVNEELQTVNNEYQLKIKQLAELNDDLNNYFKSSQDSQIYVDRNLTIRKFTQPTLKQVNLKESDIGRSISDISTTIKFSTFIEDINSSIESSGIIEKEIQTVNGDWFQMRITPYVRLQDNTIDGVIITFNDVTALKTAQKKLIKINEDHNTFIYAVSHDLKGPAINIEGLVFDLDGLVDSIDQEIKEKKEIKEITEMIVLSVKKLNDTISELSDITKIEQESLDGSLEAINLNDCLNDVKLSIEGFLKKSKAKITVDFQEPEIFFSKKNLKCILLNLLTNAIKYKSPERDPEISIRTKRSGNYIVLSVGDNGIGISKEDQGKIFSKFKRVNAQYDIEGAGIGLYLIKKIITNGDGIIQVESEKGVGSVFKVCFKI